MSGFNDGFGGSFDQDVIDENSNAPAVKKRKQTRSSEKLREAQNAYADRQMMKELGLTAEEYYDE